jgi:7-cyano-7-deazaguanine reductase
MEDKKTGSENLSLLGSNETQYPAKPEEAILEVIPNMWLDHDYVVELDCHEFTCLCPKTSQPDFARIKIYYIPNRELIESKALKLYLFSFRNTGIFHEFVINKIANELNAVLNPKFICVEGDFMPRGGIAIKPRAFLGDLQLGKSYKII